MLWPSLPFVAIAAQLLLLLFLPSYPFTILRSNRPFRCWEPSLAYWKPSLETWRPVFLFLVMTVRVPKASAKPTGSASCFWKEKFRRFGWPLPPGPRLTVLVGWGIALFCGAEKKKLAVCLVIWSNIVNFVN